MDDEDLEKVKETLENSEFNNEEEDQEIIEQKESVTYYRDEDKGNKIAIIVLCCLIVVLAAVLIILLLPKRSPSESGSKNNNNNSSSNNSSDKKGTSVSKVNISKNSSYFINGNYLYVIQKDKGYVTDLNGKVIFEDEDLSCSNIDVRSGYIFCEKGSNSKVKYTIKRIDDSGNMKDIIKEDEAGVSGRKLYDENKVVLGIYSESKKGNVLYFLNDASAEKVTLNDMYLYTNKKSDSESKTVYARRYAIVSNDKNGSTEPSSKSSYGLYDTVENRLIIKLKYQEIAYIKNDLFKAKKDGKYGVIDSKDSTKLGFKYDKVEYANGLFFALSNGKVTMFDASFHEVGKSINCSSFDVTAFADKVILHTIKPVEKNSIVDKSGVVTDYDFYSFSIYGGYLITLKDKTISLYDSSLNKVQDFVYEDANSITLSSGVIFLGDYLIFNGRKLFDITSGKFVHEVNNLSRSYQGYFINLSIHDNEADAVISLNDQEVGKIENIDVIKFLKADNNGISLTNQYFIFSVGDKNLILPRS